MEKIDEILNNDKIDEGFKNFIKQEGLHEDDLDLVKDYMSARGNDSDSSSSSSSDSDSDSDSDSESGSDSDSDSDSDDEDDAVSVCDAVSNCDSNEFSYGEVMGDNQPEIMMDDDIGGRSVASLAVASGIMGTGVIAKKYNKTTILTGVLVTGFVVFVSYMVWRKVQELKKDIERLELQQTMTLNDKDVEVITLDTIDTYIKDQEKQEELEKEEKRVEQDEKEVEKEVEQVKVKMTLDTIQEEIVEKVEEEPKNVEKSKVEEHKVEEPKVEEPKVEESKAEESKVEEPKVEEPKAEEPKVEEPKVEEPKVEEPKIKEPKKVEDSEPDVEIFDVEKKIEIIEVSDDTVVVDFVEVKVEKDNLEDFKVSDLVEELNKNTVSEVEATKVEESAEVAEVPKKRRGRPRRHI